MHVLFVAPHFPANQRHFVRGLKEVGARVTGIGDAPEHGLDDDLKRLLDGYVAIANVTDASALEWAVRDVQRRGWVDRLEAVIEAHMLPTAWVRQQTGIPGLGVEQVRACRDKTFMKEVLRKAGIPCAASAAVASLSDARSFAEQVGYPLILKPLAGAGAAGTIRVDDDGELAHACAMHRLGAGGTAAIEEFVEGHEGLYDTLLCGQDIVYEGISHYFPNVLHAMRHRHFSPKIITTNQVETNASYVEVRRMGRRVIEALGLHDTATHQEWFFGPKGLRFSEIGARPPGVCFWDVHDVANDIDLYRMWAEAIVHGRVTARPSRRQCAGIMALRPSQDGRITGYGGLDEAQRKWGEWIFATHLPDPGTPTQPVDAGYMANAWVMMRHPDFDTLQTMMTDLSETVRVWAG